MGNDTKSVEIEGGQVSALASWLCELDIDYAILNVDTDTHDGTRDSKCSVCSDLIHPFADESRSIDAVFPVSVARIRVLANGYAPEGEILGDGDGDDFWPIVCERCVEEAEEIMRNKPLTGTMQWIEKMEKSEDMDNVKDLLCGLVAWRGEKGLSL